MASITFSAGIDLNTAFLNMPGSIDGVTTASATTFEVGDPRFTVLRLDGIGFGYSSPGVPNAGLITGFSLVQAGTVVASVANLAGSLELRQVESLRLSGVADVLLQYLLSSDDVSMAGEGDQVILSEGGNDTLDGGPGADYISAGEGNDLVISRLGQGATSGSTEVLLGGAGIDKLIIDRSDQAFALIFDLAIPGSTTMLDGTRLSSFEQMDFSSGAGNDDLAGGALDDTILGAGGNDRISGREGTDILSGGDGADVIDGGRGTI
jgi:Ca2+-binding RTX toxin-like protein